MRAAAPSESSNQHGNSQAAPPQDDLMPAAFASSLLSPSRQPFLYLTTGLVVGILLDRWAEPPRWIALTVAIASIACSIKFIAGKRDAAATLALIISIATTGALLSSSERNSVADSRLKHLFDQGIITPDDPVELTGVLLLPPEPAPGAYYLDIESEGLRLRDEVKPAAGCVRLIIPLGDTEAANDFQTLALDYGSRVRALVRLERGRSYRNPGSPDFNDFLERSGYDLTGTIKSPLLIERVGHAPVNKLLGTLYQLRLSMMSAIDARFTPYVAGTLKAMLVGNRYFLDQHAMERLRESSTFHIISISGMHIGIIAWALLGLGNALGFAVRRSSLNKRRAIQVIMTLLALWCYALMVGLAPPVSRAVSMISVGLIGPLFFRRAASINTVALAAFIMLALKPALVADPGFQLSFIAVAAIVVLALPLIAKLRAIGNWRPTSRTPHPPCCSQTVKVFADALFWNHRKFNEEMRRAPVRYRVDKSPIARTLGRLRAQPLIRGAVLVAITSTAIQLSTLPLMALYFNRVAPVGILLNIVAGLLTSLMMLSGVAAIILAPASAWIAAKLLWITVAAHALLVNSIEPFANIPGSTFRVAHYENPLSIIYALYFAPLIMFAVLIDKWRPVDHLFPIERGTRTGKTLAATESEQESGKAGELTNRHSIQAREPSQARESSASFSRSVYSPHARLIAVSLCALALFACLIAVARPAAESLDGKLTIHFLDVGQGDSALVVFPHGATMLVDAGGEIRFDKRAEDRNELVRSVDSSDARDGGEESKDKFNDSAFSVGEAVVSRFLWSQGRTQLDYVLATHTDADHIGGLSDVIENFRVGEAIIGHAPPGDSEFDRFARTVTQYNIALSTLGAGERFDIEGVRVEVLWPPRVHDFSAASRNNDSVVLRFVYGSVAILLVGDIEREAEYALVQSGMDLRADVLKVAHHGSKTSSTESFIDCVQPACAVISVGERSRFGHPHAVVTERYLSRGVRLFQTGRDGMVTIVTDGATLNASAYRK
jgi:competence protein ComEC